MLDKLPAPAPGDAHPLEAAAVGLLPVVVAHGAEPLRAVAALLMLGLAQQAPALDDSGLPRCFGPETLQPPAALAAQARLVLVGNNHPPEDPGLAELLQALQTLARTLARVVTDPLRAGALGFGRDHFQHWVQQLENARKPNRLPARLQRASDDSAGAYLALDFLPRLKRWKDQHSAMGGQKAPHPANGPAVSIGLADALQQALAEGAGDDRFSLELPVVKARPGRLKPPPDRR